MKPISFAIPLLAFLVGEEKVVPIPVAITAAKTESGFVLGKDVEDSTKDISKHIKGKWLKLVETDSAVIEVRVSSRERGASGHNSTLGDKKTTLTRYTVNAELYVRGELIRTLQGIDESEFSTWGGAARNVKTQLEDFVESNYANLR